MLSLRLIPSWIQVLLELAFEISLVITYILSRTNLLLIASLDLGGHMN